MVVGAVLDEGGRPIAAPMRPGNTTDAATLAPVVESLKERFGVGAVTLVADRGMVSAANMEELGAAGFTYILGVKMRLEKKAMRAVLSRAGRYRQVAGNLKVKEVVHSGVRYVVCVNPDQARKDAADREAILAALEDKLGQGAKSLIGNSGYRRYLKVESGSVSIDAARVAEEASDARTPRAGRPSSDSSLLRCASSNLMRRSPRPPARGCRIWSPGPWGVPSCWMRCGTAWASTR